MQKSCIVISVLVAFLLGGCFNSKNDFGSEKRPIKIQFVPAVDTTDIEKNLQVLKKYLQENTPYKFSVTPAATFLEVVDGVGKKNVDIAAINTFGYVLAHEKHEAQAMITVLRHGSSTYQSQFLVRADSGINSLNQLSGKKLAFVDAASISGYLLPMKTLKDKNIEPQSIVFAKKHDSVVELIYQGKVDGGATFYSPPSEGKIDDARRLVLKQYPDVEKKIKILDLSEPIPNDPIIFGKHVPTEVKGKIAAALLNFALTDEGKFVLNKIYGVTELKKASDADYNGVRDMLRALGKNAADLVDKH